MIYVVDWIQNRRKDGWTELWVSCSRTGDIEMRSFQRDSIRTIPKCVAKIHFSEIRSKKFSIWNSLRWDGFLTQTDHVYQHRKAKTQNYQKMNFCNTLHWYLKRLSKFRDPYSLHFRKQLTQSLGRQFASFCDDQIKEPFVHFTHPTFSFDSNSSLALAFKERKFYSTHSSVFWQICLKN